MCARGKLIQSIPKFENFLKKFKKALDKQLNIDYNKYITSKQYFKKERGVQHGSSKDYKA